jgi:hypothetical protein
MDKEQVVDAWLVYYSENEWFPACLFYEPQSPEDYFRIDKVKVIFNPKEENE